MKQIILLLVLCFACCNPSGVAENIDKALVGSWQRKQYVYTFNKNGTYLYKRNSDILTEGVWEAQYGTLYLNYNTNKWRELSYVIRGSELNINNDYYDKI